MGYTTDTNRIFGLDIFRALAIIIVVMTHGAFMLRNTALEGFPYLRMIDGVDLFFVLSGFLIGGILLKEFNKDQKFESQDLLRFWKRRWFRTLPNYYLILALNYIVVNYGIINENIESFNLHFLTFTHNFNSPFYDFFWESWSLSIEEWFYIITPILCLFLLKFLRCKPAFLIATLIMIAFPLLYRYSIHDPNIDRFWWDVTFRKTVLCRLDSIGYGLLAAWVYCYYPNLWRKVRLPAFMMGAAIILFLVNYKSGPQTVYKQVFYFSILSFSVMLLLPLASIIKSGKGVIAYVVQHISKISYSMYLINLALVAEVIRDNFAPKGGVDGIIKYVVYWLVVIVASTLIYKYFEKPMTSLRDKRITLFSIK